MDRKHAASRKARRAAALGGLLAGVFAASGVQADTCSVDEKVLRDGIVSLAVPSSPPETGLDLISLGTVTDPVHNATFSVWRVFNNSATAYRTQLEAPGGERVSLLVRAYSETTLRSDSLDASASHSLIVNNAAVDQAALAATTFADSRELQDSDCMFDGNPLYAGEHAGTLKISTVHGAVVAEIPGTSDLSAIAVEHPSGQFWTLRGSTLRAFDLSGAEVHNLTLPISVPAGTSGRQRLAFSGDPTDIWLAIGPTLYRLDYSGQILGSVTYGDEIREINAEGRTSNLWVLLESDVHVVKGNDDVLEPIVEGAHVELPAAASAMVYDTYWNQAWVVAGSTLRRYDNSGAQIESLTLTTPQPIEHLAADGSGGVWAANANRLFHVQADGSVSVEIEAFATGTAVIDLATDPADGTAWVAAGSRIKHFGRDGVLLHDLLSTAPGGGARQFRLLELFADRTPPYMRIVAPAEGATVTTARPTLQLEYYDPRGRGMAEDTLELSLGEQVLPVTCDTGPMEATCVPTVDLPQGEVTIWPRIFDLAGNESGDRPRTFTIQSGTQTPPQVHLNYPYEGMLTTSADVTVLGWVVDATELTLNAAAVTLGSSNYFWHEVQLVEGPNALTLIAVGAGGASTQLVVNVVLDTTPPAAPNLSLIQASIDEETGHLRLVAPPGTFEPFARLRVFNATWGYTTTVVANADGSLATTVYAEAGHQLRITVGDEAGNEREQVDLPYAIDQLSLTITAPASSPTVDTRDLIIRGTFTGPADASVTANGIIAAISGSGGARSFVVRVRLAAGQNAIQLVAVAPGRPQVAQQIIATRSGDAPFRIEASETDGPAPLEVEFNVQRFDTTRIQRVEVDFEGDGVTDTVTEGSRVGAFVHEYLVPGSYTATFRIRTSTNVLFTYQVPVVVHTAEERNISIQATWQRFRTALASGDISAALDCMLPSVAENYSSALTSLQSSLPQIVTSFSDLHPTGAPGLAEYVLMRDINGQPTAFLVYFARGSDGVWRIAGM